MQLFERILHVCLLCPVSHAGDHDGVVGSDVVGGRFGDASDEVSGEPFARVSWVQRARCVRVGLGEVESDVGFRVELVDVLTARAGGAGESHDEIASS